MAAFPRNVFPKVICSVCNREVEYMETFDDWAKDERVLRVKCHGDSDEMRIDSHGMIVMSKEMRDQLNHGVGYAFTTPRLPKNNLELKGE